MGKLKRCFLIQKTNGKKLIKKKLKITYACHSKWKIMHVQLMVYFALKVKVVAPYNRSNKMDNMRLSAFTLAAACFTTNNTMLAPSSLKRSFTSSSYLPFSNSINISFMEDISSPKMIVLRVIYNYIMKIWKICEKTYLKKPTKKKVNVVITLTCTTLI